RRGRIAQAPTAGRGRHEPARTGAAAGRRGRREPLAQPTRPGAGAAKPNAAESCVSDAQFWR
ncbi:MAG: hypothetical protein HW391_1592, partial [Chloroflexi bacterium]|nr:hypothetical protein [Chloroflexota bacterium]